MTMKNVTLKELWDLVLKEIKNRLNNDQSAYSGFFAPTELYSLEKDEAIIKTDSNIAKEMLQKTYNDLLLSSLFGAMPRTTGIFLKTLKDLKTLKSLILNFEF